MTPANPPNVNAPGDVATINLGEVGARVVFQVEKENTWAFQVWLEGATWPTGTVPVLAHNRSQDGYEWQVMGGTPPADINAEGWGSDCDTATCRYISLVVTTAGATNPTWAKVAGYGKVIPQA